MATTQVGTATIVNQSTASSGWTHSHALPSGGSNRYLLIGVIVTQTSNADIDSGVTFDGVSATKIAESGGSPSLDPFIAVYGMPEADLPAGGSNYDVAVTLAGAEEGATILVLLQDAGQDTPTNFTGQLHIDVNSATFSQNLTSVVADSLIVDFALDENNSSAITGDETEIISIQTVGDEGRVAAQKTTGSGTVALGWSNHLTTGSWEVAQVSVEVFAASASNPLKINIASYTGVRVF